MHVLSVQLEGFRSFKCSAEVAFTPGLNVIVGQNGAGKSNLLEALASFLPLGDLAGETIPRKDLRHQECPVASVTVIPRQNGASTQYDEIFLSFLLLQVKLCNEDGRFRGHGDVVTVRKVLSDKQESFTFQGKTVKKEEFLMLVRTAGFSVRNPCNVVKQGQISAIAIGGDERR